MIISFYTTKHLVFWFSDYRLGSEWTPRWEELGKSLDYPPGSEGLGRFAILRDWFLF